MLKSNLQKVVDIELWLRNIPRSVSEPMAYCGLLWNKFSPIKKMAETKERLIEELIDAKDAVPEVKKSPKRNSKTDIIEKILQVSEQMNQPVLETDSQLKRMSKRQLTDKLAELIEKRIEYEATKVLGISSEQAGNPFLVNLAA